MKVKLDLHVHSDDSPDGRMTLPEIAAAARARGVDGVAVCDHDKIYTGPTEWDGVLLIPGVEFSTEYGHLLGLFVRQPIPYTGFRETVAALHAQGALAVLAHPFARTRDAGRFRPLIPLLDGVEVWNGRADRKNSQANAMAAAFAREAGLCPFGGSDAHVAQEVGNGITAVEVPERTLPALHQALKTGEAAVSGQRGKSWYVACSQHRKLQKTGASLKKQLKWAAFAGKCLWEDLENYLRQLGKKEGGSTCHSLSKRGKRESKF